MKWARLCWKTFVTATTICNCFAHTGVFTSDIGERRNAEEEGGFDVESSINENLNIIYPAILQARDIEYNPPDEHDMAEISSKDSIIEHVVSTFGAQPAEDDEDDSADSAPAVPIQQLIDNLQNVLSELIMDDEIDIALEKLIRRKISTLKAEIAANATQKSLADYFTHKN